MASVIFMSEVVLTLPDDLATEAKETGYLHLSQPRRYFAPSFNDDALADQTAKNAVFVSFLEKV
jgi:hypothetical protein